MKCYRILLNAKTSTPYYMLYGEIDILPLQLKIKKRMISYWAKLISLSLDKLSRTLYNIMLNEIENRQASFKWVECIKNILNESRFSYVWRYQNYITKINAVDIHIRLYDVSLQLVRQAASESSKGKHYFNFKNEWRREEYFKVLNHKNALTMFKFRTCNHRLPVETGRFRNIPHHERLCTLCSNDVGDEYHYLMECSFFRNERKKFLDRAHCIRPNVATYMNILNCTQIALLRKLSIFMSIVMKKLRT